MANLNKKCIVCGTEYKYCNSCPSDLNHPSWMALFDKKNCKDIFNILSAESQKFLTKEKAKEELEKQDLSKKESFNINVKNHIDRVLKTDSDKENIKEATSDSNEVVDIKVIEESSNEEIIDVVNIKSVKTSKIKAASRASNK